MRIPIEIAAGGWALATAVVLSGCAATVVPEDEGEAGPTVGVVAEELRGGVCRRESDCPLPPGFPCTECDDGSSACPEVECVRRRCVYSVPECPPPPAYDPCAGKSCGDLCTLCDPDDPDCVETAVVKLCQLDGSCSPQPPMCSLDTNPCTYTLCPKGTECVVIDTNPPQASCVPTDPCATVRCAAGTHCEGGACLPDAPKVFCGGFLGIPCPGAGSCVDDPSDDCDPNAGGADCSGMCVCDVIGLCRFPGHWDDSPQVCGCTSGGGSCGGNTCGPKEFCCNPSCGICAPIDGACTDVFCPPTETDTQ